MTYKVFQNGQLLKKGLSYEDAVELKDGKFNRKIVEEISHEEYLDKKSGTAFTARVKSLEALNQSRHNPEDRDDAVGRFWGTND